MNTEHTVTLAAVTEARLLSRSWVFRFLSFFSVIGLAIANVAFFVPNDMLGKLSPWMLRCIPSAVPYFNILVLTSIESLMILFGAAESFRRDSTFDTYQSIHTRDFTTVQYIIGKALGILIPFLILNALVLFIILVINGVFMDDVPVVWQAYLFYPILIGIPALVFVLGLSFMVTTLFRFAPFALILLLIVVFLPFFITSGLIARLIDYNAIHLPLLYSDFVGFGNIGDILLHQGAFFFLGLGFVALSAIRFKRLPQSIKSRKAAIISACALIVYAVVMGTVFVTGLIGDTHLREQMQALNKEYVKQPRARVTACNLEVEHRGSSLTVQATLTLTNHHNNPLDHVCLSLNPGYTVNGITSGGQPLVFVKKHQILDITLPSPLMAGAKQGIVIAYHGAPDDRAMYPDIGKDEHLRQNRLFTYVIDKRHAFVTPNYLLLTPESLWYPVSGIPYGLVFPDAYEKDFVDFTLNLKTKENLTVISQGEVKSVSEGKFQVRPDTKLPGLTLIAGEYETKAVGIDGMTVKLCFNPGHDYYKQFFTGHENIVTESVKKQIQDTISTFRLPYPSTHFSVVEVPVQFYAYERPWRSYMDTVQPHISLIPEKGCYLSALDFKAVLSMYQNLDDEQIISSVVKNTITRVLISDYEKIVKKREALARPKQSILKPRDWFLSNLQNDYMPGYHFNAQIRSLLVSFESESYPVFNAAFETFYKYGNNRIVINTLMDPRSTQALLDEELACLALQRKPFQEYLYSETDDDTLNLILILKAAQLFSELQSKSGNSELASFMDSFIASRQYEQISLDTFAKAAAEAFGTDITAMIDSWYHEQGLPLFEFADIHSTETIYNERTVYQTSMIVTNREPVPGIISIQGTIGDNWIRFISMEGYQSKEVSFITDEAPFSLFINTIVSKNLPILFSQRLGKTRVDHAVKPFEGERIIEYRQDQENPGIIVVDNLDSGFDVVSNPSVNTDRMYYGFGMFPEGYIISAPNDPPSKWGKAVFENAYGGRKTAHYIKHGSGDGQVCWTAEIPLSGTYNLEYYTPEINSFGTPGPLEDDPDFGLPLNGNYSLKVQSDTVDSVITFTLTPRFGWQYVSTFELAPGLVKVYLSNESKGRLIYADAIQWVKK